MQVKVMLLLYNKMTAKLRILRRTFPFHVNLLFYHCLSYGNFLSFNCFIAERDRILLFPDNFFFAERRFVNHIIDTKKVEDLDHCELFCYMNDKCVSANFKKEPEPGGMTHVCELNNATHLDYDTDLITDANFYHRGSKVSYN